jgi:flagellar biosynthetic protein FliQ
MTTELPTALMREGFAVMGAVGAPIVGALLVVGLIVGLMQAATQINDSALGFLPRLLATIGVTWAIGPWALERLATFFAAAVNRMSPHL